MALESSDAGAVGPVSEIDTLATLRYATHNFISSGASRVHQPLRSATAASRQ